RRLRLLPAAGDPEREPGMIALVEPQLGAIPQVDDHEVCRIGVVETIWAFPDYVHPRTSGALCPLVRQLARSIVRSRLDSGVLPITIRNLSTPLRSALPDYSCGLCQPLGSGKVPTI